MGSYCSVMNNTDGTMYCKFGADLDVLEFVFALIGDIAEFIPEIGEGIEVLAEVGEDVVKIINLATQAQIDSMSGNIDQWFKSHSYGARSPNTEYISEKESLSLVQTAYCGLVTYVGNGQMNVQVGSMTVWSGKTDNDNNVYKLTDVSWQTIQNPSDAAMKGNLAQNPEVLAKIKERLNAKGKTIQATPGAAPPASA